MNQKLLVAELSVWKTIRGSIGRPVLSSIDTPTLGAIREIEQSTGMFLPYEYKVFISMYNGETGNEPFFRGVPFCPFEPASRVFRSALRFMSEPPYLWQFSAEDSAGLFIGLKKRQCIRATVYYSANGIEPQVRFRSITSLMRAISACWDAGCRGVVDQMPFGEDRRKQDAICSSISRGV